ncbi:MAG: DUF2029 domain-containing protein [Flavobacteriales bacterium]|nr:DUF2029 domain-containing protein [Flavobacteriales bacterium]
MKKLIIRHQFLLLIIAVVLSVLAVTLQSYYGGDKYWGDSGPYTKYNNYLIFKQSFEHLIDGNNLYELYPTEHWDFYKYTPTFSLLFSVFYILPDGIGLFAWNLLNSLLLFWMFWKLDWRSNRFRLLAFVFILFQIVSSMQSNQSNSLIAGLLIGAFLLLESRKYYGAMLLIVLATFIKPFALVGLALCLFYPQKLKMAGYFALNVLVLFLLPVLVTGWDGLIWQYQNWFTLLGDDHSASYGFSVMGGLNSWFDLEPNKLVVLGLGVILFCLPLIQIKHYQNSYYRLLCLASVLIWVILFNHKAESQTYVIAVAGMAIWYFSRKRGWASTVLILVSLYLVVLAPTDLVPRTWRKEFLDPYVIRVIPCLIVWLVILYEMMMLDRIQWKKESKNSEPSAV